MKRDNLALDNKYMRIAIKLALKGKSNVYPNPLVGCVIVKNNKIVGKGYHSYFGGPHAEINAIKDAGEDSVDAELYINLEPCVHWGKTPPCVDSIIKAGIKRVIASIKDPNSRVSGKGFKKLVENKVEVSVGVLSQEAMKINNSYIQSINKPESWVILKSAMSLDGKIATRTGNSKWITSEESRTFAHKIRSEVDAVIVGVNTVIKDNPELTAHGIGKNPVRVVIDPSLRIPIKSKILDKRAPTVLFYNKFNKLKLDFLKKKGIVLFDLPLKNLRFDFKYIIKALSLLSINRIMIEGGGETNAYALKSGIVDEVFFFIAPIIIGGRDALTPIEGEGVKNVCDSMKIAKLKVKAIGSDILITGIVKQR